MALLSGVTCIVALYVHVHRQGRTTWIDKGLISVTGGLQSFVSNFGQGIKGLVDHYFLLVNAKKQNEELQSEVGLLRSRIIAQDEILIENKRLQEQLSFKSKDKEQLLSARVVAHDVSPDFLGIRIDRGSNDGVQLGMGVVHTSGVVGRVLRVTPLYSDVQTLLDPSSNIDVVVQRSRARGILSGQSKQLSCKLKYIDRLDDVMVNDTLYQAILVMCFLRDCLWEP
ncbi:rod shape-determining protein MreC [bacterium]|nr:rod shape-determining protein MreC [bacterium]